MIYFLMHENDRIAVFEYENQNILALKINDNMSHKLPFLELSSKSLEDRLIAWILNRGVPVSRQGIKTDLNIMGEEHIIDYMIENLGLSLTDHYWICPKDSDYTWEKINLYQNDFSSAYSLNLSDDKKSIAGRTNFVPNASLKGDLRKKWIIDEKGIRRLVKGNYNNTCRQSLCEVLATEIHKRQGKFEYSPYTLIKITSDGREITGCECPSFTSINTEFIPAIDIINSIKKSNQTNYYDLYIQYCGTHGIDMNFMREFMEYQILTDFIITNTDRHLNNFGIIRDSRTQRFFKPAPIFDSGNSMFYNTSYIRTGYNLLDIEITSFKKREVELLQYVSNPMLININKLPSAEEVYQLFMKDSSSNDDVTLEKLTKAYQRKVEFLQEFQSGVKIFSYNYLKKHKVYSKA